MHLTNNLLSFSISNISQLDLLVFYYYTLTQRFNQLELLQKYNYFNLNPMLRSWGRKRTVLHLLSLVCVRLIRFLCPSLNRFHRVLTYGGTRDVSNHPSGRYTTRVRSQTWWQLPCRINRRIRISVNMQKDLGVEPVMVVWASDKLTARSPRCRPRTCCRTYMSHHLGIPRRSLKTYLGRGTYQLSVLIL